MARSGLAGSLQTQLLALFFKPIPVDGQLADLLVQPSDQFVSVVLLLATAGFKELREPILNDSPPLRHQGGMHLVFLGKLGHSLDSQHGFQSNFGLEARTVFLSFSFHGSAFSHAEQNPESRA